MNPQDNLTRDEARERAKLVSEPAYEVELDVTGTEDTFTSRTAIRFASPRPGASTFVDVAANEVTTATLNGHDLAADAFDGHRLRLDELASTNELVVEAVHPYRNTGMGMHHFRDPVDGEVYLHTQFEPFDAHAVFACFDQPDIKGTFTFHVDAPEGWEVVSNTRAVVRPGSGGRWTFAPTPVMSTYIAAVCAGPFEVVRDRYEPERWEPIDLAIYCRRSLAKYVDADEIFEITKQGFDFFQDYFDYPYPLDTYDQVFCPEYRFGAMENWGCITFTESYIFRSRVTDDARQRRAETILHEMAHMWFGDLVTMRWWDDLWLNESFATYMALLALANATRFTDAWTSFARGTKAWAYREDQLPSTHPIVADMPDIESVHLNFDGITYAKGASVLKQLVAWVGDDAFRDGLRNYFRRHEYGNTTLDDFLACLEEGSGRDLGAWSKEWLETAGVNTLGADFTMGDDGTFSSFALTQTAPDEHPHVRSHRVGVGIYATRGDALTRDAHVEVDAVGERSEVPDLVGRPAGDLVLVNDADHAYAKLRLDDRSLETLSRRLSALDDSLARALCWNACWDMVRDADLPASDYVRIALNNVDGESDIGTFRSILAQVRSAVDVYGHPSNRTEGLRVLCDTARERMRAADPASDRQLAWSRAFIASARDADTVDEVRGILDGSVVIDGLTVDTDLRWSIVTSLAHVGAADDETIAAELDRDPTDQGHRYAATARAARPLEEAKAEAWERMTGEDIPLATLRALIAGFRWFDQEDLLEPYAQRYFGELVAYWDRWGFERGLEFAEAAYPAYVPSDEVLRLSDVALARDDLPPPLRRILREGADDVRRILRARQRDR